MLLILYYYVNILRICIRPTKIFLCNFKKIASISSVKIGSIDHVIYFLLYLIYVFN